MSKSSLAITAVAASLLLVSSARGQDKPAGGQAGAPPPGGEQTPAAPKPKWVLACEGDMKRLCKEEMKGDVRPCLKAHEKELSEECSDIFLRPYRVVELCKDDIAKFCKDEAASGAAGKCLIGNKDKLSEKCRSAIAKGSKEHLKQKQAAEATEKNDQTQTAETSKPVRKRRAARSKP
jgi:hypothetical protein